MSDSILSFASARHDSNVSVYLKGSNVYTIELERLYGNRYLNFQCLPVEQQHLLIEDLQKILAARDLLPTSFHAGLFDWECTDETVGMFGDAFNFQNVFHRDDATFHHKAHAAGAFYASGFDEALIFSHDGGGNDGTFCVFEVNKGTPNFTPISKYPVNALSTKYCRFSTFIREICSRATQPLDQVHRRWDNVDHGGAGKLMGLSAYGSFRQKLFDQAKRWMDMQDGQPFTPSFWSNFDSYFYEGVEGVLAYDFAFNAQRAFEECFLERFVEFFDENKHKNICLTGGGALNVVLNERLSKVYPNVNFFVPSSPGDSGLSYGMIARYLNDPLVPEQMYTGCEILDKKALPYILDHRPWKKATPALVAKELESGKIIGVCRGDSETGPRALGNRTILADPRNHQAKDIINHKVKFREWYRPFAPVCKEDKASTFFETSDNACYKYMSFSPQVRKEYRTVLPAVTHVDGSSRLQTVSAQQNQFIYEILDEFEKLTGIPILVNTSFNTKGKAILTRYLTAIQVLDSTGLDSVVLEDYYIYK